MDLDDTQLKVNRPTVHLTQIYASIKVIRSVEALVGKPKSITESIPYRFLKPETKSQS